VSYLVIIEPGDTSVGAYVPDLPGCVAVGATEEEALRLIKTAIGMHLEGLREQGLPVPEPRSRAQVVGAGEQAQQNLGRETEVVVCGVGEDFRRPHRHRWGEEQPQHQAHEHPNADDCQGDTSQPSATRFALRHKAVVR
jgi:predicted RNase H-like HicB family nuclease